MRVDLRNSAAIPIVTCGVVAVVAACLAVAPQLRSAGWSLSALPRVAATTDLGALARRLDPGFHTVRAGAYDGQFYWGVAVDPLATGPAHRVFDKASYRYGHPLYGWLAWAVSGGQARAVPAALFLVGLASLFAAAALAAALGHARGGSGWEGLLIALNPGLVIATGEDLAEPLAAAVALAAIAALVAGRRTVAWFCLALLPFAKEPLVLLIVAVVVYELAHRNPRRAAVFATAAIPVCAWWTYARFQLGAWFTSGDSALGPPLLGWWRALAGPFTTAPGLLAHHGVGRVIATCLIVMLLALLLAAGLGAMRAFGPVELAYLALAALALCLAPNATASVATALRNTAFLVALVPFVIAGPRLLPRSPSRAPAD